MPCKGEYCALVGMHGKPEKTGLALRDSTKKHPIDGWDVEIANPAAVREGVRYVKHNMSIAFDDADYNSEDEELRRTAELIDLADDYKYMFDIHDRPDAAGEYAFLSARSDPRLLGVAALLGMRNIVMSPDSSYVSRVGNGISLEFCRDDANGGVLVQRNVRRIRQCMGRIARRGIPYADPRSFRYYEFVHAIPKEDAAEMGIDQDSERILPFQPLPARFVEAIGLGEGSYVVENWNGINSSQGEYFGEILRIVKEPPF